jgi:hypothetical protein
MVSANMSISDNRSRRNPNNNNNSFLNDRDDDENPVDDNIRRVNTKTKS